MPDTTDVGEWADEVAVPHTEAQQDPAAKPVESEGAAAGEVAQ